MSTHTASVLVHPSKLSPTHYQNPRARSPEQRSDWDSLRQSIAEQGILEPIIVAPKTKDGYYPILAGWGRYAAALACNFELVPVVIHDSPTPEVVSLAENVLRENLHWTEIAASVARLAPLFPSGEALAKSIGVSGATISRYTQIVASPLFAPIFEAYKSGASYVPTSNEAYAAVRFARENIAENEAVAKAEGAKLDRIPSPQEVYDGIAAQLVSGEVDFERTLEEKKEEKKAAKGDGSGSSASPKALSFDKLVATKRLLHKHFGTTPEGKLAVAVLDYALCQKKSIAGFDLPEDAEWPAKEHHRKK